MSKPASQPREIKPQLKAYAFERSLGIPPAEACRRVGGKVENGQATKWEQNRRVQAWIAYYRSLGHTEEMLIAKRQRIEQRLELAAFGNILDMSLIDSDRGPWIDWEKVAASPYGVIVSSFKFDKDTGKLVDFERDNALAALAQLRDMHGFKAPSRAEVTGKNGTALFDLSKLSDEQLSALEGIAVAAGAAASP